MKVLAVDAGVSLSLTSPPIKSAYQGLTRMRREAVMQYSRPDPAVVQHPTDEHWLPFYVAAGAGGLAAPAVRLHDAVQHGALAMDAYAFGAGAERLAQALGSGRPLVQASVT